MNAERLLAHYEQIADAPDAIARLRRFIVDLAVRGKLVPQNANDEPASELLKRSKKNRSHSSLKEAERTRTRRPNLSMIFRPVGSGCELGMTLCKLFASRLRHGRE